MYQPRRAAAPTELAVAPEPTLDQAVAGRPKARYALESPASRAFTRTKISLGMLTAVATAGAVLVGSAGDTAVAMGVSSAEAPAAATEATAAPLTLMANVLEPASAETAAAAAILSYTPRYATTTLNVRAKAKDTAKAVGTLTIGAQVLATSETKGEYREIAFEDGFAWVSETGLSEAAPIEAAGTTWDACSRGSAIEGKLRKDTVHIYRSVCALFPAVNSYGGWRAGGLPFHRNGRAVDIMLTPKVESALGHRIAKYLIAHAKDFNIDHIIFEQHIWTPSTPRWRKMADRGSLNANHFNHVHVAIKA